jgi:2-keto-4-pentenoate hydratase/2-oxohepta-3-ene-1,7-dioic acid hydratase in catechol pathway
MQITRVRYEGDVRYGVREDDAIHLLDANPLLGEAVRTGEVLDWEASEVLPSVEPHAKIVGIGMNYPPAPGRPVPERPLVFLKATSSLAADGEAIELPDIDGQIVHEGELAVIIGRRTKNVSEADAMNAVFGYTIVNDVTARDLMLADVQWARGKSFDTFCPIGPVIDTELDHANARISTSVNGEPRREGNTRDLVFSVPFLISYLSRGFTLNPGDVIMTGSPPGDGEIAPGDEVTVTIEGIGTLRNPVTTSARTGGA